jgi:hypothetical protein
MIKKKHKCSNSLITDMLKLLVALKVPHVPSSWFKLKERVKRTEEATKVEQQLIDLTLYFCPECQQQSTDARKCTNEKCSSISSTLIPPHTFLVMNIQQQIEQILKSTDQMDLHLTTQTSTTVATTMTDVYHGRVYKNIIQSLRNEHHNRFISLTANIDGVAIYTSSEQSMWTFTACLNELDRSIRFNIEKMISMHF